MNNSEMREKSVQELGTHLHDLLKEQFNLRMQRGSGQLAKNHLIRNTRRNIARVKTIINEKQGS